MTGETMKNTGRALLLLAGLIFAVLFGGCRPAAAGPERTANSAEDQATVSAEVRAANPEDSPELPDLSLPRYLLPEKPAADGPASEASDARTAPEARIVPEIPEARVVPEVPETPGEPEIFSRTLTAGADIPRLRAENFTADTTVEEVIALPQFEDFGSLLFPEGRGIKESMSLRDITSEEIFPGCSAFSPEQTVRVLNDLKIRAERGEQIFLPIYSEEERKSDPQKNNTGLFWFHADPPLAVRKAETRAREAEYKTAVLSAGGGFIYVAALAESLPEACVLAEYGVNAFALIYRPDRAYADLFQAVVFLHDHAGELGIDMAEYSLWGASSGGRMAASAGTEGAFRNCGRPEIPGPAAVICQYTGYTNVSRGDPPTFGCAGIADSEVDWKIMQKRLDGLRALGIPAELHTYRGLGHGFGTGEGTAAEGWMDAAFRFWEAQITGGEK